MLDNFPDILTVQHLQEILSIGRSKAYQLLRDGDVQYVKIGRQIRIPKIYLVDFLSKSNYNVHTKSSVG